MMKILIIGGGGREHALAWAAAQSPRVSKVFVAPGNGGTSWPAAEGRAASENVPLSISDLGTLSQFARDHHIDLTIVGPEAPLADGIVDLFHREGLRIFGPTAAAAQLESSKLFAKRFMNEFNIPTARYESFTDHREAVAYLAAIAPHGQVVVKANGLASGRGVVVCNGLGEAQAAVRLMLQEHAFGAAGSEILIEEKLEGQELTLLAFADGRTVRPLLTARDYKRIFDNSGGANTGGMGAIAPVKEVSDELIQELVDTVLQPTVNGMEAAGMPYIGVLYAGLMMTSNGPRVLEFNCRLGDPETQAILPLLKTDLVDIVMACTSAQLRQTSIEFREGSCATVVMASPGYPGSFPTGAEIRGVAEANQLENVTVFHSRTRRQGDQLITNGGRVLGVSGWGKNQNEALQNAYAGVTRIGFAGAHFRTDIGR